MKKQGQNCSLISSTFAGWPPTTSVLPNSQDPARCVDHTGQRPLPPVALLSPTVQSDRSSTIGGRWPRHASGLRVQSNPGRRQSPLLWQQQQLWPKCAVHAIPVANFTCSQPPPTAAATSLLW